MTMQEQPEKKFRNTAPEVALQSIRDCKGVLVLDFDYNLYLGNSTEDYLGTLRPAWLAYALIRVITFFVRVFGPFWGILIPIWRDYLWVYVTHAVFIWSRWLWPRHADKLAREKFNGPMVDAIKESKARRIIIISFGYAHVLTPLVKHLPFQAEIVASKVGCPARNLRIVSKNRALQELAAKEEFDDAVFVTDSKDDNDLLSIIEDSHCVPWIPATPFPFRDVYVPFRYTAEGKYAVPDILWNQHVTEDLAVLLLAYVSGPSDVPSLLFLFISFFCVYEMGYFENNTLAASRESNPTVAAGHAAFCNTRIYLKGAIWTAVTGVLGCFLLGANVGRLAYWMAALLLLRGIFHVFNRIPPRLRIFVFPYLQIAKTFSYAPLFGLSSAGALLLVSQVMRQTTNYMIYRNEGNIRMFRRQAHRLLIFSMGAAILPLAGSMEVFMDPRFYACMFWCVYRMIREKYGHGLRPVRLLMEILLPGTWRKRR
jgi:hypothetical protein